MIKLYEVTKDSDVFAISLVENPAIEENFIYLSAQKPQHILLEDAEKHIVMGAVLVPDKPIYRNQGGEEFYIQFSRETIETLAYDYMINKRQHNTTVDHQKGVNDVVVVETWLKTSENDKSNDYGMDLPVGTWLATMKVNNDDVWKRVKSGELQGFSIESMVNLDEIKLDKKDIQMENIEVNDSFWSKLKDIISKTLGKVTEEAVAEEVAVEEAVEEVKEVAVEEAPVEEPIEMAEETPTEETVPVEEMVDEIVDTVSTIDETPEEVENDLQAIVDELNAKIAEMQGEIETKDAEIEALKKVNTELSAQPSTKQVKVNASAENGYSFLDYAAGRVKLR